MGYFTLKDDTYADIIAEAKGLAEDEAYEKAERKRAWPEFARFDDVCDAVKKVVREERYGVTADYIARKLAVKHYSPEEVRAALALLVSNGGVGAESEEHEDREKRLALAKGFQEEPDDLQVWFVPSGRRNLG